MGESRDKNEVTDKYSLRWRVFHKLREDILSGKYSEHEELKEATIGAELGVSRTPVREALRQLELEGLVSIVCLCEYRSARVAVHPSTVFAVSADVAS